MTQFVSFQLQFNAPERLSEAYFDLTRAIPVDDLKGLKGTSMLHYAVMTLAPEAFEAAKEHFLGDDVELVGFGRNGETRSYRVDANYSGRDADPFGHRVDAVDEAEAEFQTAWEMTNNQRQGYGNEGITDAASLESFLDAMTLQNVHTVEYHPVSDADFQDAFIALFKASNGEGDLEAAKEQARLVLEARNLISEPVAAPAL